MRLFCTQSHDGVLGVFLDGRFRTFQERLNLRNNVLVAEHRQSPAGITDDVRIGMLEQRLNVRNSRGRIEAAQRFQAVRDRVEVS